MSDWVGLGTVVGNLLDDVFTSDEERQQLTNELAKIDNQRHAQVLALEGRIVELQGQVLAAQSQIITAEANGESLLQRCWRPITMLTFLVLIVLDSFGVLAFRLSEQAWELLQLGIGGYVIGRSVEKAAPSVKGMAASAIKNIRNPSNGHS
ncbi:3TM-type holin [Pseudoalteromonas galatheae]|uniref:3TM-type holin n=1 Tax=Pseudoalteromonas galatheae TaxID=579562 RepID=UPI0030CDF1F3